MKNDRTVPLVVHIIYSLDTGGLENGLVNIINRMPTGRYRHAIICLTTAGDFAHRITAANVQIITLNKLPGHDLGVYCRVYRELSKLRPAIVHTRNLASLEMQVIASLIPGTRRVHGEHGRDINDLQGKNSKYRMLRRCVAPFVNRYIAVSQDLATWLKETVRVPPGKVRQIYNGVDQGRFKPQERGKIADIPELAPAGFFSGNVLVLGTVGRLAEVKNQQMLIHAFGKVLQRMPWLRNKLRLLIVGDGPLRQELQKAALNLGLEDLAWFAGDRDDIDLLLSNMSIFILPSLGEGISNTVLEAMACGLPIVATAVGGNPELVEHEYNGLLVPTGDQEALVAAIEKLILNQALSKSMGQRSLERVKSRFTWPTAIEQYMAVYDELLQGT